MLIQAGGSAHAGGHTTMTAADIQRAVAAHNLAALAALTAACDIQPRVAPRVLPVPPATDECNPHGTPRPEVPA